MFEKEALAVLTQRTRIDLTIIERAAVPGATQPLLSRLREENRKTIARYQTVMNIADIKDEGLTPATFGAETVHRVERWSDIYRKHTVLVDFFEIHRTNPIPTKPPSCRSSPILAWL